MLAGMMMLVWQCVCALMRVCIMSMCWNDAELSDAVIDFLSRCTFFLFCCLVRRTAHVSPHVPRSRPPPLDCVRAALLSSFFMLVFLCYAGKRSATLWSAGRAVCA